MHKFMDLPHNSLRAGAFYEGQDFHDQSYLMQCHYMVSAACMKQRTV